MRTSAPILLVVIVTALSPAFAVNARQAGTPSNAPTPRAYQSARIAGVARALDAGNAQALEQFWNDIKGETPLIDPVTDDSRYCWVTFVWRGSHDTRKVDMLGTMPSSDPSQAQMQRFRETELWFKTERVPKDARFGYMIRENDTKFVADPFNPRVWAG